MDGRGTYEFGDITSDTTEFGSWCFSPAVIWTLRINRQFSRFIKHYKQTSACIVKQFISDLLYIIF